MLFASSSRSRKLGFLALAIALLGVAGWYCRWWYSNLRVAEARRELASGNFATALRIAEEHLARNPGHTTATLIAARCCALNGRFPEAEAYFCQVPITVLGDFHLRGRGLVVRKLWTEAAAVYEQAVQRWPSDGEAIEQLARIRVEQKRYEEAAVLARRLTQVPSHRVQGLVMTGVIESFMNNYKRSVDLLEQAIAISPDLKEIKEDHAPLFNALADAMLMLGGRARDAEKYALKARALSPSADSNWFLGLAREQQGDEEGAIRFWKEAVALDPKHVGSLIRLAQRAIARRDTSDAQRWLKQAIAADPKNELARKELVRIFRRLGQEALAQDRHQEAADWLERALETTPNDPATRKALVTAYRKLGRAEDAQHLEQKE